MPTKTKTEPLLEPADSAKIEHHVGQLTEADRHYATLLGSDDPDDLVKLRGIPGSRYDRQAVEAIREKCGEFENLPDIDALEKEEREAEREAKRLEAEAEELLRQAREKRATIGEAHRARDKRDQIVRAVARHCLRTPVAALATESERKQAGLV